MLCIDLFDKGVFWVNKPFNQALLQTIHCHLYRKTALLL
ncbi:Uncharacterised protein [Vibrio cholerae]|nr:Uncharacterised protein [Vibrio cholerae]